MTTVWCLLLLLVLSSATGLAAASFACQKSSLPKTSWSSTTFATRFSTSSPWRQQQQQRSVYNKKQQQLPHQDAELPVPTLSTTPPLLDANTAIHHDDKVRGSKLRQLKDFLWVRETLEDLTAAEFACSVENGSNQASSTKPRPRAVDYEKLLEQLDRRLFDLGYDSETDSLQGRAGSLVYSPSQRSNLGRRLLATRAQLVRTLERVAPEEGAAAAAALSAAASAAAALLEDNKELLPEVVSSAAANVLSAAANYSKSFSTSTTTLTAPTTNAPAVVETNATTRLTDWSKRIKDKIPSRFRSKKEATHTSDIVDDGRLAAATKVAEVPIPVAGMNTTLVPRLYVREDGTVDWDGALQDQAALRKFGTAVWARINGRDPETVAPPEENEEDDSTNAWQEMLHSVTRPMASNAAKPVTAMIEDTPQIRQARGRLTALREEYQAMTARHTTLLTSALQEGQVVANVNLAAVPATIRQQIRLSAQALAQMEIEVSYQTLIYELERSKYGVCPCRLAW
jgi:hypothetical protein